MKVPKQIIYIRSSCRTINSILPPFTVYRRHDAEGRNVSVPFTSVGVNKQTNKHSSRAWVDPRKEVLPELIFPKAARWKSRCIFLGVLRDVPYRITENADVAINN